MKLPDPPGTRSLAVHGAALHIRIERGGCHRVEDRWQGMHLAHPGIGFYCCDHVGMEAVGDDDRRWPYRPDCITVIPPWFAYSYRFTPQMRHAYLHIKLVNRPDALQRQLWPEPRYLRPPPLRRLFQRYAVAVAEAQPPAAQQLLAEQLGHACLQALLDEDAGAAALLFDSEHPWLQLGPALALVEKELHRPLAVAELAGALGVGREHCSRLFRQHLGQSPVHYIQERRVARALEILRETDESLDIIALRCGCGSRQHLTRLFRRYTHASPGDWRRG